MGRFIEWLLARLGVERTEITRPGYPEPYLVRWSLWGSRHTGSRHLFLHKFNRGDLDPELHDHPWPFWSLVLWGGYYEVTALRGGAEWLEAMRSGDLVDSGYRRRWYGPLSFLRRPAEWAHRVIVPEGRKCWTLVWTGKKVRGWGFHCAAGWIPWRQHAANLAAGKQGCGED